jgi:D-threo-aldose 1-dehydrogenase
VRRFAAEGTWGEATRRGVGILNAGALYMGLLASPASSWSMGFKKSLDKPRLVSLAREMGEWAEARSVPLRALALQFAARHPAVASVPVGCRTADEVDEVVSAMSVPVPESLWADFERDFGARVSALRREDHWYYDKSASKI